MNDVERLCYDRLMAELHNGVSACAIMGNLKAESAMRPDNLQNSYEKKLGMNDAQYVEAVNSGKWSKDKFMHDCAGFGLAQHTHWSRKGGLWDHTVGRGRSVADPDAQLDFILLELKSNKSLWSRLLTATDVYAAASWILLEYEKPADQSEANCKRRGDLAMSYYEELTEPAQDPEADALQLLRDAQDLITKALKILEGA